MPGKAAKLTDTFRNIITNSGYLIFEKLLTLVVAFIVNIYVVRYLGADQYGLLQYSISLVALFLPLGRLGVSHLVIKDLVANNVNYSREIILGTTFRLMFFGGIISAVIVIFIGLIIEDTWIVRFLIGFAAIKLIFQSFDSFDYWFQAEVKSKYSVIARSVFQLTTAFSKITLILTKSGLLFFGLAPIIGNVFQVAIWNRFYKKVSKSVAKWEYNASYANQLLKSSWPFIISGLSMMIYLKIDQVMLRNMVNPESVGNYAVAVRISELWYFIPMSLISSVFPAIIKQKEKSESKYYKLLQMLYNLFAALALLVAIPVSLYGNEVILFLYGKDFAAAGLVLQLHIWTGIFVFVGIVRSKWIVNENYQMYSLIFNVSGAILNIILNLLLIPKIGIFGAAWATLISQAISSWFLGLIFYKTRKSAIMQVKAIIGVLLIIPFFKSLIALKQFVNTK